MGVRVSGSGCISLVIALFGGLMIATAGVAIYPRAAHPGAALLCGGDVRYETHGQSYRPGEYTVTLEIFCDTGSGKGTSSEEITFRAVGLAFLIYSAALFLFLRFLVAPLMRSRFKQKLAAAGVDLSSAPVRLRELIDQAKAAPRSDDLAERLTRLKALHDQGLIGDDDYEAKKAEILSGL
jgi:hypothetical protein